MEGWMEWVQDCVQLWALVPMMLKSFVLLLPDISLIVHCISYTQYKGILGVAVL
jgi:hypothetical protein